MNRKKSLYAFVTAVIFVLGIILGDVFSLYLPIKSAEFKKTEILEQKKEENKQVEEKKAYGEDADKRAEEILKSMTLDEKIYQMMFVKPETLTGVGICVAAGDTTKNSLMNFPVGGIIYSSQNVQDENQLTEMIEKTQSYSKIGLFIGTDEEGGSASQIANSSIEEIERVGDMAEIGRISDTSGVYNAAKTIANSIKKYGFNVDFAPVANVRNNENVGKLKLRGFSDNAQSVSKMSLAFVYGLQDNNMSACLKYFPTLTNVSSESSDISAFEKSIDAGCDFVMISNVSAKLLTNSDEPCSFLKSVVTDMLKSDLKFENIVITDALNKEEISEKYSVGEACVKAIEAGNDMLLMPSDIKEAFDSIKSEVESNKISESRIDESVKKILKIKIKRGIID